MIGIRSCSSRGDLDIGGFDFHRGDSAGRLILLLVLIEPTQLNASLGVLAEDPGSGSRRS